MATNDKPIKILAKDHILTDVLTLAIILTVIGAICIAIAPDIVSDTTKINSDFIIATIHTSFYGPSNVPVVGVNDTLVITFESKTQKPPINNSPKIIGECSPEAISLLKDFIANDVGDKSDGHQHSGIHVALLMCEYVQMNYDYDTGTLCLWNNPNGYIDHAQTWVEINGEKYIIETLFNDKDNRIYNVSEHKRIWDDRYKIQYTSLEKGYEHHKKYVEGSVGGEPLYKLRRIANEEYDIKTTPRSSGDSVSGCYHENDVVFVMDISASTFSEIVVGTGVTFLDYEKALLCNLLDNPDFKNDNVGVITFGGKANTISHLDVVERESLKRSIIDIRYPYSYDKTTALDQGLAMAEEMLSNSAGSKDVIVISDGNIDMGIYESSHSVATRMNNTGIEFCFIHVMSSPSGMVSKFEDLAHKVGNIYYQTEYPNLYNFNE